MVGMGEAAGGWSSEGANGCHGPAALVIVGDARRAATEDAVIAAGGRLAGRVDWRSAQQQLGRLGLIRVVLAEARGIDDAMVAPALPVLDALARSKEARIVVILDPEQIDLVAASLTAPGIELLCAPTASEQFAALCLAGLRGDEDVRDSRHDVEGARLQRLHEEVARIAETLTRLTREAPPSEAHSGAVGEPGIAYRAQSGAKAADISSRQIREAIRARRLRDQYFGAGLFEDPAWDMLLDLFAAELERAQVSVSSLCIAAAVAPTTALRWISRMTDAGLFERQPDPFDRRRAYMGLSRRASNGMRTYIGAVQGAGSRIA